MDQALSVVISKAIESKIHATSFSQEGFTLERSYAEWDIDLSKMDDSLLPEDEKLRVDVTSYTAGQEIELLTRTTLQKKISVDIAVRKRFGPNHQNESTGRITISEIDSLMFFVDELAVLVANLELDELPGVSWNTTNIVEAPIVDHLRELRQFTGVIRNTFIANVNI